MKRIIGEISGKRSVKADAWSVDLWWRPAEREVIPHRHLASPGAFNGCPFSSRQVQALISPTCDTPHSIGLHRSPTTPTLAPPTPATPMSPLDALRRLQFPTDISPSLSPSQEEDLHIQHEISLGEGSNLSLESEAEEEAQSTEDTTERITTE
ncbi:hypothetical protein GWK47_027339 [Chionoecetes opilio]|uniref:Uncharacterized protein n=1 Tax=Chionoecetes opilio TaxID=41210 RepID=A0A8J8WLL4_CHIOP|nr:hypothetical protein GWK47_027339 [Chionoecetes opilio]